MSLESTLFDTLKGLVSDRVYPDIAPQGVTALPRITYQQVGGAAINFLEPTIPSKHFARVQVNTWGATRLQVSALSRQVENALRVVPSLQTTVLGEPVATHEPDTKLFGTRQDFGLFF